jgi:hypothetical protein
VILSATGSGNPPASCPCPQIPPAQWQRAEDLPKTLNAQGSIEGSVDIAESAITGSYSLEVYTSNDVFARHPALPDRRIRSRQHQSDG